MYLISLIKIYNIYYYINMYLALEKKKINMYLVVVYNTYWVMKYCTLLFYILYTQIFFIDDPSKDKFLASSLFLPINHNLSSQ